MKIETVVAIAVFFALGYFIGKKNPGAQLDAFLDSPAPVPKVVVATPHPTATPVPWMQAEGRTSLDKPAQWVPYKR